MADAGAALAVAQRDVTKFLQDRPRIIASFIFPFMIVVILGNSFKNVIEGIDFLPFVLTGVFAQTVFQSSALGLVSLLEDRDNDFSQELFVAPVSRYAIIVGKISGEALVALVQGLGILAVGYAIGARIPLARLPLVVAMGVVCCLLGGAFGLFVLSTVKTRRFADQLFGFVFLPQFFLAGVFNPTDQVPGYLEFFSRIAPMRYAVEVVRSVAYGDADRERLVPDSFPLIVTVIVAMFVAFVAAGTALFVRNERNR
ncbi:MAG: ABC transporter permease [Mycobacteriales bacterium]